MFWIRNVAKMNRGELFARHRRVMPLQLLAILVLILVILALILSSLGTSSVSQFDTQVVSFSELSRSEISVVIAITNVSSSAARPNCLVSVGPVGRIGNPSQGELGALPASGESAVEGAPIVAPGRTIDRRVIIPVGEDNAGSVTINAISVLAC